MNNRTLKRLAPLALLLGLCLPAAADRGVIREVDVRLADPEARTLELDRAGAAHFNFSLIRDGRATVHVYDAAHRVVRTLAEDRPVYTGANSLTWDGRDDAGAPVPDEAYYFALTVEREGQADSVHDPALISGGERIGFPHDEMVYDAEAGVVRYALRQPARVLIRAGIADGPALKTIANWVPRPAGPQAEPWDGMDASGLVNLTAEPGYLLLGRGYTLPENSVVVTGSPTPSGVKRVDEAAREAATKRTARVQRALAGRDRPIDPHAMIPFQQTAAPSFDVEIVTPDPALGSLATKGPVPVVSGTIGLRVTLGEATAARLMKQRFEIITYVDYTLVNEEEQGYSPYTAVLDTSRFANGEHLVTVNVAGLQDQLDAWSARVNIQNLAPSE